MEFTPLVSHLSTFLEFSSLRPVNVDGISLSLEALVSVARHQAAITIDESTRKHVQASRYVLQEKLDANVSIYGVTTGFGGSASTRTQDHLGLGLALFQMQQCGIISSMADHFPSTIMPESWVRAAILIRINSLVRGHSGVRWELPLALQQLLAANITPLVPLRGSISASGDLSPLSYVAGTVMGSPSIKVYDTCSQSGGRVIVPSHIALSNHNIPPLIIQSKEHLGLLNGTAFSAAVTGLVLHDAVELAFLTEVCTAMATEALLGSRGSFVPFVNNVARPHPGQIDAAQTILGLLRQSELARTPHSDTHVHDDNGTLKQDRYALRTSPQFIGPQLEDIHSALVAVTRELNSTTDNPLIESSTKMVHDTGNFQAMAVTNAMEKTRLSLHHLGKILFAQATEIMNPDTNKGLPPSLASTDPSLNFHCKGVEISLAAYVSELGFLANPVSTHIQSAEMHNQAVNSLALLSARQTVTAVDVLTMVIASCIYLLCQALDLRALECSLVEGFKQIIVKATRCHFAKELCFQADVSLYKDSREMLTASKINTVEIAEEGETSLGISLHDERGPLNQLCSSPSDLIIHVLGETQEMKNKAGFPSGADVSGEKMVLPENETPCIDVTDSYGCNNISCLSDNTSSDYETIPSSATSFTSMGSFPGNLLSACPDSFIYELQTVFLKTFWQHTVMDAAKQVQMAVDSLVSRLLQETLRDFEFIDLLSMRRILPNYRADLETECLALVQQERERFLTSPAGELPTARLLGLGSRHIYQFVRKELGIGMHGIENLVGFEGGLNSREATTGEKVSLIYDCIKDGRIHPVLKGIIRALAS